MSVCVCLEGRTSSITCGASKTPLAHLTLHIEIFFLWTRGLEFAERAVECESPTGDSYAAPASPPSLQWKSGVGTRRHLPDVSDPADELRVAGKPPPPPSSAPGGQRVCCRARCSVAATQWRAGELRTRGRARKQRREVVSSGFISIQ